MSFDAAAKKAARDRLRKDGEPATYTPPGGGSPVPCHALVEKPPAPDAAPDSPLPMITLGTQTVTLLVEEVPSPRRDGTVTVGSSSYVLDTKIQDDGYETRFLVK